MREEYNFKNAKRNPYVKKEKQQITITLDSDVIAYFKEYLEFLEFLIKHLSTFTFLIVCLKNENYKCLGNKTFNKDV